MKFSRRKFNIGALSLGSLSFLNIKGVKSATDEQYPDISAAVGPNATKNTEHAISQLGGIKRFVKEGQTVDILINFMGRIAAAHTGVDVFSSVVEQIKAASPAKIRVISWIEENRRSRNKLQQAVEKAGVEFHHVPQEDESLWEWKEIPQGKILKKVRIFKALNESDVFITIPKFKHHGSARYSGCLKLAMGISPRADNRGLLHANNSRDLEQCIADLNSAIRKPDLIVVDMMETLITNGPSGPGKTSSPNKVIAGTDRVALDTYCLPLFKINPLDKGQVLAAHEMGCGEIDLNKLNIVETEIA